MPMKPLKAEPEHHAPLELLEKSCTESDGRQRMRAVQDAMGVLGGKWKMLLIGALAFKGKRRFSELLRDVEGIGPKMLSKELHDLELNELVTRTVHHTKPITVEYEMTEWGRSLIHVIHDISSWGMAHGERIMKGHLVVERAQKVG